MSDDPKPNPVAALNDAFRRRFGPGWLMTAGLMALGDTVVADAVQAVMAVEAFDEGDDPYGEHDFGAITVRGHELFWKIDCYDLDLAFGSPDPADPAVTRRVLTIMLAEDY